MTQVEIGQPVPDFEVPATGGGSFRLAAYRGRAVVLYFYPKASTPGCTQESQDFRDLNEEFEAAGAMIVGASRDGLKAQDNFQAKLGLPFPLLSDAQESLCTEFGVLKQKNMYGKQVRGIERSTFLIDGQGVLRREWRGVRVPGHAAEVLEAVRDL